ncbi:MAG: sulfatase [Sedimentisphaeraceae bacterium JB056]
MKTRRDFMKIAATSAASLALSSCSSALKLASANKNKRPNVLFCISDDQSWVHASAYGASDLAQTPVFDRLAEQGVLFTGCFSVAPSCSPARASLLTGRNIWQNEEAGVHLSLFPAKFPIFSEVLGANGYRVGTAGKVWGPGDYRLGGENVARTAKPGAGQRIEATPAAFEQFIKEGNEEEPFFFWFGAKDPHRPYDRKERTQAWGDRTVTAEDVPPFLPDIPEIREDLADYAFEIERFDSQVGQLLDVLKKTGQAANTMVVVTGDNGMPFPRAKRECYEYGTHVPLVVSWPAQVPAGRVVDDLVSFIDLGPTFLDAAGVKIPEPMTGRSLLPVLKSDKSGLIDEAGEIVVTGRERHNMARPGNACYPVRAIRDHQYLYIRNLEPDRDPVGASPHYADIGYYYYPERLNRIVAGEETDKALLAAFKKGTEKRPAAELYDIKKDPGCLVNLAAEDDYQARCEQMWAMLKAILVKQGDPRMFGKGECFESVPTIQENKHNFPGVPPQRTYTPGKMHFDHSQDTPWKY